jgi:hypothetical protein
MTYPGLKVGSKFTNHYYSQLETDPFALRTLYAQNAIKLFNHETTSIVYDGYPSIEKHLQACQKSATVIQHVRSIGFDNYVFVTVDGWIKVGDAPAAKFSHNFVLEHHKDEVKRLFIIRETIHVLNASELNVPPKFAVPSHKPHVAHAPPQQVRAIPPPTTTVVQYPAEPATVPATALSQYPAYPVSFPSQYQAPPAAPAPPPYLSGLYSLPELLNLRFTIILYI